MRQTTNGRDPIKSALFVDFDNVYSGLRRIDEVAAEHFATNPARWLTWIEQGLTSHSTSSESVSHERSILIRRCYLNPTTFWRYRPNFTRSAFSVIDCPPLTQQGKNSSDIHMVVDILDALEHPTRFDEFIIFSGDSDFTPVLLRLRAYDRRTMILTGAAAAQSYKAASDTVVTGTHFIAEGLTGFKERAHRAESSLNKVAGTLLLEKSEATELPRDLDIINLENAVDAGSLADKIAGCAKQYIDGSSEPVDLSRLAKVIVNTVGWEVIDTRWAGAGGLKKLLRAKEYLGFKLITRANGSVYIYDAGRHDLPFPPSSQGESRIDQNRIVHVN